MLCVCVGLCALIYGGDSAVHGSSSWLYGNVLRIADEKSQFACMCRVYLAAPNQNVYDCEGYCVNHYFDQILYSFPLGE